MANTYRTATAVDADKQSLLELHSALNASPSALRRDGNGLWTLRGSRGYCSTFGDGTTWLLAAVPEQEISPKAWTWVKKRLSFATLTQDGDTEGCFRLHHLPSPTEAEVIRDIRKRVEYAAEELERRQEHGRRLAGR